MVDGKHLIKCVLFSINNYIAIHSANDNILIINNICRAMGTHTGHPLRWGVISFKVSVWQTFA